MVKKSIQKSFSKKEIKNFFEEISRNGKVFTTTPSPEHKDLTSDWVITSGSSKQSNKLIKVSTWQTGQTF